MRRGFCHEPVVGLVDAGRPNWTLAVRATRLDGRRLPPPGPPHVSAATPGPAVSGRGTRPGRLGRDPSPALLTRGTRPGRPGRDPRPASPGRGLPFDPSVRPPPSLPSLPAPFASEMPGEHGERSIAANLPQACTRGLVVTNGGRQWPRGYPGSSFRPVSPRSVALASPRDSRGAVAGSFLDRRSPSRTVLGGMTERNDSPVNHLLPPTLSAGADAHTRPHPAAPSRTQLPGAETHRGRRVTDAALRARRIADTRPAFTPARPFTAAALPSYRRARTETQRHAQPTTRLRAQPRTSGSRRSVPFSRSLLMPSTSTGSARSRIPSPSCRCRSPTSRSSRQTPGSAGR